MTEVTVDDFVAALVVLAEAGIPSDIQELLVRGDPSRSIKPNALFDCLDRKAFDAMHQRAMNAEATCEKLAKALDQAQRALASMIDPSCIAQTTVIYAFATATTAEATARHVLSEYRKEAPNAG